MATITIKLDSEQLAREVLEYMGYLPTDDLPDLITIPDEDEDSTPVDVFRAPKTEVEAILERMAPVKEEPKSHLEKMIDRIDEICSPKPTRRMPETPKQNAFCTNEEPSEGVEPVDNEIGAPLEVYSEEAAKEQEELRKYIKEVVKPLPPAPERLAAQLEVIWGEDRLNYLDAMLDHSDPEMRKAAKEVLLRDYAGHTLRMWPSLQKVLDGDS